MVGEQVPTETRPRQTGASSWRPKVAVVDPGGKGGLCHYAYNLCRALSDYGCEVHLITGAPYELEKFPRNFTAHAFPLRTVQGLRDSWRCIRKLAPDILHQHGTNLHPLFEWSYMHIARRLGRAAFVYTCHQVFPHENRGWQRPFIGYKLRAADAVIVHNQKTQREALTYCQVRPERLHIIPHGNYRFFRDLSGLGKPVPWRKEPGIHDILFFGAIRPYKGLRYLIEAIGILRAARHPVRLMIVGQPIEDWAEYEAAIQQAGIQDSVLLQLGYLAMEDVPGYFEFADAVCLPYLEFSESGVLQLADAFDIPIIATNVGGNTEAYAEGYVQALVPPKDADALADALEKALSQTDKETFLQQKASRNNKARDWATIAEQTVALYASLQRK
jgi:glycosyltransferase involved in cell wall biosynthesis